MRDEIPSLTRGLMLIDQLQTTGETPMETCTEMPDLLTEAKAIVKEWEKDHTVENMDALITAICNHTQAPETMDCQCPKCGDAHQKQVEAP